MRFDALDLIALAFLMAVAVGYGVPLGRWFWRRTLLVDRRVAVWREQRRTWRAAMREGRR